MSSFNLPQSELIMASRGPLRPLEETLIHQKNKIEDWFEKQWDLSPPPNYGSVDIRQAGFKLAPVDMNLYPAGFNNLSPASHPLAMKAVQKWMSQYHAHCRSILIIPENHSRNRFYWENIQALLSILTQAGFETRIGGDAHFFPEKTRVELANKKEVLIEPIQRQNNRLLLDDFNPDLIWLNNDFSSGIPDYLNNIEQTLCPPKELGWHSRLKSVHFSHYKAVIDELSQVIGLDPWLLSPFFECCSQVNFMQGKGQDCLISNTEKILEKIQKKYDEYHLTYPPFLIIKADAGTYGMSVMSIKTSDELKQLNRKQRSHMSASKGSQKVTQVIIQEGVYSLETIENASVAEPVIYMIGKEVVGGFYRIHKNRTSSESLNAPGMEFEPVDIGQSVNLDANALSLDHRSKRFYIYGIIARLSMLAAAREQRGIIK